MQQRKNCQILLEKYQIIVNVRHDLRFRFIENEDRFWGVRYIMEE